jgi:hypothetical protein
MAALILSILAATATAGTFDPAPARAGQPNPIKRKVAISLRLDGLSAQGGEVEIKPGHAGCKFETITFRTKDHPLGADGKIYLDPIEVETVSADRDCSFAITLKEPGQPDKTVRRNLRLAPASDGKAAKPQPMTCFITSNSMDRPVIRADAKDDDARRKK